MRVRAAIFAIWALAGCASVSDVTPGHSIAVGDGVSLTPDSEWSELTYAKATLWTIDGVGLNELHFHTGIQDGKPLYAVAGARDLPLYAADMPPSDIQDLVIVTMGKEGYANVRAAGLKPCRFGEAGFCFDLTFATAAGLEMKGRAIAGYNKKKLELILFYAPAEYYYGASAPALERLFATLQIREP